MPASVHSWDDKTTLSRPSSASNTWVPALTRKGSTHLPPMAHSQLPRQEAKKSRCTIALDHLTCSVSTMLIPERPIAEESTLRESLWAIFRCSCIFLSCRVSACGNWQPARFECYAHLHPYFSEWLFGVDRALTRNELHSGLSILVSLKQWETEIYSFSYVSTLANVESTLATVLRQFHSLQSFLWQRSVHGSIMGANNWLNPVLRPR